METIQSTQLKRVSSRSREAVLRFFLTRVYNKRLDFRMQDLQKFVVKQVGYVAPDSPSRVMRMLRKGGSLNYEVLNRAGSQYRVLGVSV